MCAYSSDRTERLVRAVSKGWLARGEGLFVAGMLLLAGLLRLALAVRGWPDPNSDEATTGLMADDILWHGAHPAFTYGIHHVGALDAYLQAPFFAALGPTRFALHVTTTLQFLAFLLVFYLFSRRVFSAPVAMVTLALLAVGAEFALYFELRAGHYAQDMLLLGALLLWLVVVRLGHGPPRWRATALDFAIGLVAGLALWSTILLSPFVGAAALALGVQGWRRARALPRGRRAGRLLRWLIPQALGVLLGLAPFLIVTVGTRGAVLAEAVRAASAGGGSPVPAGPVGVLVALGQQIAGTLLFGLPSLFGGQTLCVGCPVWPSPSTTPSLGQALPIILIGAAYSGLFLWSWWRAAAPLARATWAALFCRWRCHLPNIPAFTWIQVPASPLKTRYMPIHEDPCVREAVAGQWGRAMLVIGCGGALLQYMLSRTSYVNVDTAPRYISDLYLCTPLIADQLACGAGQVWCWLRARRWRMAKTAGRWPGRRALLASTVLLALLTVNVVGAVATLAASGDRQHFGVPAGLRDVQAIAFLEAHHATRFYTTWWVCHRLMFDARERVVCYIINNANAEQPGFNPMPAYAAQVLAAPHPAYLFDLTTPEVSPAVPQWIAHQIAAGDPRFADYAATVVGGYLIFYYAGR